MKPFKLKTNRFIIYYILLLLIFISWQNYDSVPNGTLRIVYLAALLLPLYFSKIEAFPAVIMLFYTIAMCGFTTSYMPARYYTYLVVTAIALFVAIRQQNNQKIPIQVMLLFALICFINLVMEASWQDVSSAFLMLILFFLIAENNYEKQSRMFTYTFIVSSLVLAVYYIVIGPRFIMDYRLSEGLERVGFTDINYGGTVVGMGLFASFVERVRNRNLSLFQKIIIDSTIGLSMVALIMNASRGAVLSVVVAAAVILLFSRIKTGYKIVAILAMSLFVGLLYSKGYMDLLFYRIENDDLGGGSGRFEIWQNKIDNFLATAGLSDWFLGLGYTGGRHLGYGAEQYAFHNDFLAFLVEYGLFGFALFLLFFFRPLHKAQSNKPIVIAGVAFLFITCMTLEPFAAGRLPFYAFWFYLMQLSQAGSSPFAHRNS